MPSTEDHRRAREARRGGDALSSARAIAGTLGDCSSVAVIATGPSLTRSDAEFASRWVRIAVNDAYRFGADISYACDGRWWDRHAAQARQAARFCATCDPHAALRHGLAHVRAHFLHGLGTDALRGMNSGQHAVNLAWLMGAKRIVLLGFDMKGEHFFGSHPWGGGPLPHSNWIKGMERAAAALRAAGVEVINATRDTALTCFPRAELESLQ